MTTDSTVDALPATPGDSHPQVKDHHTKPISDDEDTFDDELVEMFPTRPVGDEAKPFVREMGYPYRDGVKLMHIDAEPRISSLPGICRAPSSRPQRQRWRHRGASPRASTRLERACRR